jgi:uncharacterized protein (TIGR03086 family)
MGVERASAALVGGVAVLERAIAYLLGSLAMVTPEALTRSTPCDHWDLYDLLDHLDDSLSALHEAVDVGCVACGPSASGVIAGRRGAGEMIIVLVRDRAVRLLGGWAHTGGAPSVRIDDKPMTAALVAGAGAIEVTLHGWDVARACGRPRPIPSDLADELLDLSVLLVRGQDRPGRFRRPVVVPADAPPGDRLVAFLGRWPSWYADLS